MIFIDATLFFDHLGKGENWQDSYVIFQNIQKTVSEYYASAISIVFLHMHFFKYHNKNAQDEINELLKGITIVPLTNDCLVKALDNLTIEDFEDGIQFFSAKSVGCQIIITRNPHDFRSVSTEIEILKPREFIQKMGLGI